MRKSGYLAKSACHGYRPHQFSSYSGHQRERLIAHLMKDRSVPRFVVAPAGYGKTSLVLDYAETVFSWIHVFWLNGKSPCFIRDLDNRCIASECLAHDPKANLVVVDDLPQLDAQRAEYLSAEMDRFLKQGCEVIVICTPACDLLGAFQRDRLRIGAVELLLSDDELDLARSEDERVRRPASQVPPAGRVPALVWGEGDESAAEFVASSLDEDLPADLLLAACSAYVLQRGVLSDLAAFGPIDQQLISDVFVDYPHFGFDPDADLFQAPALPVDAIAKPLKSKLDVVVGRSEFQTRNELVRAWANALMATGFMADRACEVMRALCPVGGRAGWLVAHARTLAAAGCFYSWLELIDSLRDMRHDDKARIAAAESLCRAMLGDEAGALRCAKRFAFDPEVPDDARAVCLIQVCRNGIGELQLRASEELLQWADTCQNAPAESRAWWDELVTAWNARMEGVDGLLRKWPALHDRGAAREVLCLAASWLFALAGEACADGCPIDAVAFADVQRYVHAQLSPYADVPADFFAYSAGLSMEEAYAKGMPHVCGRLDSPVLYQLKTVEASSLVQRRRFQHNERLSGAKRLGWPTAAAGAVAGASGIPSMADRYAVPILELKLFGRFDVSIGGVPVNERRLARKNTRRLLVLLATKRGRDLPRDSVIEAMWPSSSPDVARRNFYTVWSQLRRALTLPDGTCPYLVRHQFGCRLDERYVHSDVARLDDICRELLFGRVDFDAWQEIYAEIDRDFGGELMPAEKANPLILQEREKYTNRLVDALVAATGRLSEADNPEWGIWFARAALSHDKTREDAYVALMHAQVANGQRTAAMKTYLTCRRVLSEELGIDPSADTDSLYGDLLGDE